MNEERKFIVRVDKECHCIRLIVLGSKLEPEDVRQLIKELTNALFEERKLNPAKRTEERDGGMDMQSFNVGGRDNGE